MFHLAQEMRCGTETNPSRINGRSPPSKLVHRNPDSECSLLVLLWAPPSLALRAPGVFSSRRTLSSCRSPVALSFSPRSQPLYSVQHRTVDRRSSLSLAYITHHASWVIRTHSIPVIHYRLPALQHEQKLWQFVQQLTPTRHWHWHDISKGMRHCPLERHELRVNCPNVTRTCTLCWCFQGRRNTSSCAW